MYISTESTPIQASGDETESKQNSELQKQLRTMCM